MNILAVALLLTTLVVVSMGQSDPNITKVAKLTNEFAVDLYKKLIKANENLVCSPFATASILTLLWEGSEETATETEIMKALHYDSLEHPELDYYYHNVIPVLQSSTHDCEVKINNSVWANERFHVNANLSSHLLSVYYAEQKSFKPSTGADDINSFVKLNTNDKINKIVDPLTNEDALVLVSSIYFKSLWKYEFDVRSGFFIENDQTSKRTNLMGVQSKFLYGESTDLNSQVLSLPYSSCNMSLLVFLPKENSKLSDLESNLDWNKISAAIADLKLKTVCVTLPKFSVASNLVNLNSVLMDLGIKRAFNKTTAQFPDITNEQIYVSKVVQAAFIDVYEKGTEAASAVEAQFSREKVLPPKIFNANHPFLYILYDNPTMTALFMGRYTKL